MYQHQNHFNIEGHNFNTHTNFMLIEQLNQTNLDKPTLRKFLAPKARNIISIYIYYKN